MTRFIIHIGPHKTGTTYIQNTLRMLSGFLLERGIYVPAIWNAAPGNPSHSRLAQALVNRATEEIRYQVRGILGQKHRLVVISSEDLSSLGHDDIFELRQLFDPAPTEVVYYVRRWPERLPSKWQEGVKFGRTNIFPEFLARQLTMNDESALRDASVIERFTDVFGATQMKVASYSYLVDNQLDIASHFLSSFLGISDIELPPPGRPNASLPIFDTEVIRALNAIHARHGGVRSPAIRTWYLTHKEGLVPEVVWEAMRANVGTIRLDEGLPQFATISRDLLNRFAGSIIPPHSVDCLHEPRVVDVRFISQDYLMEPVAPRVFHEIYEMYRKAVS